MKISELLIEKSEHDITISYISKYISSYIFDTYLPLAVQTVNNGTTITQSDDLSTDKKIVNLERVETTKEEDAARIYMMYIGTVGELCRSIANRIDKFTYESISDCEIYMGPLSGASNGRYYPTLNSVLVGTYRTDSVANKKRVESTLSHELRHALDNAQSGGEFGYKRHGDVSDGDGDSVDKKVSYLRRPYEAGARFTQMMNALTNKLSAHANNPAYDKKAYMADIQNMMEIHNIKDDFGHLANTDKQYRRFISRALDIYDKYKGG